MNFREIYNPRKVYDGYFETYFIRPFYHQYFDFKGRESRKSFLLSLAAWLVVTLGVFGIMMGQVGLLGPEVGFRCITVAAIVWGAISLLPILALVARASHGAPAKPLKARFLGIDTMLAVSCLLFFILGLLMMTTTLNSGSLDPNAAYSDDEDSSVFEMEEVTEEPIFTYQDEAAQTQTTDSLDDMNEPDLVSPEESFDPTLTPQEPVDSLF